jgi:hypothetical protein
MTTARTTALFRALRQWSLLAAASAAAASVWAAGLPEEGYLLDARLWQEEVAADRAAGHWPADGWFRLTPGAKSVDVRAVTPKEPAQIEQGALYFRLPGAALKQGARAQYRQLAAVAQPMRGKQYELALGQSRFGFSYAAGDEGVRYDIAYGGAHYSYRFTGDAGSTTRIRSIADLDGDAQPDFLLDVDDQTYLLLSTQARPGLNVPTAELWAAHDGC